MTRREEWKKSMADMIESFRSGSEDDIADFIEDAISGKEPGEVLDWVRDLRRMSGHCLGWMESVMGRFLCAEEKDVAHGMASCRRIKDHAGEHMSFSGHSWEDK